jgi:hypothetical protein
MINVNRTVDHSLNQPHLHTLLHGTTLWNAWQIWHNGFVVGPWGHMKNGNHRNGIWGFQPLPGQDAQTMIPYAMDRADSSSNPTCERGVFDAWSCPVCIEFRFPSALTRIPAGTACLENLGSLRLTAGVRANVRPWIAAIHINVEDYTKYRDVLSSRDVRHAIKHGHLIMCTAPWSDSSTPSSFLVNPNKNPCGKVVPAQDVWNVFHKRGKRFYCAECNSRF